MSAGTGRMDGGTGCGGSGYEGVGQYSAGRVLARQLSSFRSASSLSSIPNPGAETWRGACTCTCHPSSLCERSLCRSQPPPMYVCERSLCHPAARSQQTQHPVPLPLWPRDLSPCQLRLRPPRRSAPSVNTAGPILFHESRPSTGPPSPPVARSRVFGPLSAVLPEPPCASMPTCADSGLFCDNYQEHSITSQAFYVAGTYIATDQWTATRYRCVTTDRSVGAAA